MKKIFYVNLVIFPILTSAVVQPGILDFTFVKNCITYSDNTLTDELNKKGFSLLNNTTEDRYYSNQVERENTVNVDGSISFGSSEIAVHRYLLGEKNTVRSIGIHFSPSEDSIYIKNFLRIEKSIIKSSTFQKEFYSSKFQTVIKKYVDAAGVFYYIYWDTGFGCIMLAKHRIDELYFS